MRSTDKAIQLRLTWCLKPGQLLMFVVRRVFNRAQSRHGILAFALVGAILLASVEVNDVLLELSDLRVQNHDHFSSSLPCILRGLVPVLSLQPVARRHAPHYPVTQVRSHCARSSIPA